jgi:REP element-mobilizing transposase RayT
MKIYLALSITSGNVINRIPIFKSEACCKGFFEVLRGLLQSWPSKIIAYVVMPDHFHLILNPRDGNIQGFGAALKSLGAKKIIEVSGGDQFLLDKPDKDGSIHQFWQESFKAFPLWSAWMSSQKIDYIHANPVKAKLVSSARDYLWSSFRAF